MLCHPACHEGADWEEDKSSIDLCISVYKIPLHEVEKIQNQDFHHSEFTKEEHWILGITVIQLRLL